MSRNRTSVVLALLAAAATGAACAGSASETPWPVEPVNLEPGPAGERPQEGVDVKRLPNQYGEPKTAAEQPVDESEAAFEEQQKKEKTQREQDKLEEERDRARIEKRKREQPGGQGTDPMRPSRSPMMPY